MAGWSELTWCPQNWIPAFTLGHAVNQRQPIQVRAAGRQPRLDPGGQCLPAATLFLQGRLHPLPLHSPAFVSTHLRACYQTRSKTRYRAPGHRSVRWDTHLLKYTAMPNRCCPQSSVPASSKSPKMGSLLARLSCGGHLASDIRRPVYQYEILSSASR